MDWTSQQFIFDSGVVTVRVVVKDREPVVETDMALYGKRFGDDEDGGVSTSMEAASRVSLRIALSKAENYANILSQFVEQVRRCRDAKQA